MFKPLLKRKKLEVKLNLLNEFDSVKNDDWNYFLSKLDLIEKIINKSKFLSDDNYVYGGRRKFLYEEFLNYASSKQYRDAFANLIELMLINPTGFPGVPGDDLETIQTKDINYNNTGIISLEEKELIMKMINILRESIKGGKNE